MRQPFRYRVETLSPSLFPCSCLLSPSRIEISIAETLFHRKIKIKLTAELYDYLGFNPRVLASIFSWISFAIRRGISTSGRLLEFRDSTLAFEDFPNSIFSRNSKSKTWLEMVGDGKWKIRPRLIVGIKPIQFIQKYDNAILRIIL